MLPKSKRIPRGMHALFKVSKTLKGKLFLVRNVEYQGKNSRFSFSVSKKVAKSAYQRNKARRQGYITISKIIDIIVPNQLISFSYKSLPKKISEVEDEIYNLLSEAKLITHHDRIL